MKQPEITYVCVNDRYSHDGKWSSGSVASLSAARAFATAPGVYQIWISRPWSFGRMSGSYRTYVETITVSPPQKEAEEVSARGERPSRASRKEKPTCGSTATLI
jgi:hypothetical protein